MQFFFNGSPPGQLSEMFGSHTLRAFYHPHSCGSKMHSKRCVHTSFDSDQAKDTLDLIDVKRPDTCKKGLFLFFLSCIIIMADISDSSIS